MKLRKIYSVLLFAFILLMNLSFFSQNLKKIDSLNALINISKDDSNKVNLYFELSRNYDYNKSNLCLENSLNALNLAKRINYVKGIKKQYNQIISIMFYKGVYDLAIAYYHDYEKFLKENNLNDDLLISYNMYGNLLRREKKYKEAIKYYHLSRGYHARIKNEGGCANVWNNLAIVNIEINEYDSALYYNNIAINFFKKTNGSSALANAILGSAEILLKKKDYISAEAKALESFDVYEIINERHGMSNCYFVLGQIYMATENNEKALSAMLKSLALAKDLRIIDLIRDCYLNISIIYNDQKNYKLAYENHILYKNYNDSINEQNLQGKMMEMEVKYDMTKKESQLNEQQFELKSKNKQQFFLLLISFIILILLIISFRAYYQKKKANAFISEQKKLVDEKQKEILDSIRYAKRIQNALITNEKYIDKTLNRLNNKD